MNHFTSNKLLQKKVLVLIITKQVKLYIKTNLLAEPDKIPQPFLANSLSFLFLSAE